MALNRTVLAAIKPYLSGRILSLAYPDILLTAEESQAYTGRAPKFLTDAGRVHGVIYGLPETRDFFSALGCEFECVDFAEGLMADRVVDLNHPADLGEFDLVIDPGTTEHCFNIAQAMLNAAGAVKVGGRIVHETPRDMAEHGFYNLNKTFYKDFYGQNGWVVEKLENLGLTWLCIAKRLNANSLTFPVQGRYLKAA
jgi:hypothetical protein